MKYITLILVFLLVGCETEASKTISAMKADSNQLAEWEREYYQ